MKTLIPIVLAVAAGSASAHCCDPCGCSYSSHTSVTVHSQWLVDPMYPRRPVQPELIVEPPAAEVIVKTKTVWWVSVFFPVDRDVITAFEDDQLRLLAKRLQDDPTLEVILVDAHASTEGAAGRNEVLATNRAVAVRARLIALGVPAVKIRIEAHGARKPEVAERGELDRRLNRRVDIKIVRG